MKQAWPPSLPNKISPTYIFLWSKDRASKNLTTIIEEHIENSDTISNLCSYSMESISKPKVQGTKKAYLSPCNPDPFFSFMFDHKLLLFLSHICSICFKCIKSISHQYEQET
uniref:Uncharacterized protein n=1 Tax=Rhizophora mucronata TaxID=61149 RepID=A0A2P2IVP8_RHIMU